LGASIKHLAADTVSHAGKLVANEKISTIRDGLNVLPLAGETGGELLATFGGGRGNLGGVLPRI